MLNNAIPLRANGTIAPSVFVILDTTADNMVLVSTAGARTIGVSQAGIKRAPGLPGSDTTIAAQQGDEIMVFGLGDICMVTAGAAITRGSTLKSDGSGNAIATTADGDKVGGIAFQSASGANVLILIQVLIYERGA